MSEFPREFWHRFCSDKIIWSRELKFNDTNVLVRYKLLGLLKELCEGKNLQEFRPVDRYLVLIRVRVGSAS